MMPLTTHDDAGAALVDAHRQLWALVDGLSERDLLQPTRCVGWAVCDLLFHLLLDAQQTLMTFATPTADRADTDAVSYWAPFAPGGAFAGEDAIRHARFVRAAASAYSPAGLLAHWRDTADAAARAACARTAGRVATPRGEVLETADAVTTYAVEVSLHHLDLAWALPDPPTPAAAALRLVRRTFDGLLGAPPPAGWDDVAYALKGANRVPLDDADRAALGTLAARFPLLA